MKVAGSVALVVAADSVLAAAIARGLLARGAVKVYRVLKEGAREKVQPGVLPLFVDPARPAGARKLAHELDDVTLLVNCLIAVQQGDSALSGVDIQPLGRRPSAAMPSRRFLPLRTRAFLEFFVNHVRTVAEMAEAEPSLPVLSVA